VIGIGINIWAGACDGSGGGIVLPTPFLLHGMNTLTGWSVGGTNARQLLDTVIKIEGAGSLNLRAGTATSFAPQSTDVAFNTQDPATWGVIAWWIHGGTEYEYQDATLISCRFGRNDAGYITDTEASPGIGRHVLGAPWWFAVHVSEIGALATLGAGSNDLLWATGHVSPFAEDLRIDALVAQAKGIPTVILRFDDIHETQHSVALPIMQPLGLPGTLFVPTSNLGNANRLTSGQLADFAAAGFAISVNLTQDDLSLTSYADLDAMEAGIEAGQAVLSGLGYTGEQLLHTVYPQGTQEVDSNSSIATNRTVTNSTTNGTTAVTVVDGTNIVNGMKVIGPAVPYGTRVVSGGGTTSLVVSQNIPTLTARPFAYWFDDAVAFPFHGNRVQERLAAMGMHSASGVGGGQMYTRFGIGPRALLMPSEAMSAITTTQFAAAVNLCKLRGTVCQFHIHGIGSGGGIDTPTADFQTNMNLLAAEVAAGNIVVLNHADWYTRDSGNTFPLA
jgi:hypothetical protein